MPDDIRKQLVANVDEFCRTVRRVDPSEAVSFILSDNYVLAQQRFYVSAMERHGVNPATARILEVGAGYGFFLGHARATLGWDIWGCEPGRDEFAGRDTLAQRVLDLHGVERERLAVCPGEALTFADASFDVVLSNDVLEHVDDPAQVIREAARVLRPGGLLAFNVPNYNWIYEGHYNLPWIPMMSKALARRYVSLWGRDPAYVDTLNFLTPSAMRRIVAGVPALRPLARLDEGCEDFLPLRLEAYMHAHRARFTASTFGLFHEMRLIAQKGL